MIGELVSFIEASRCVDFLLNLEDTTRYLFSRHISRKLRKIYSLKQYIFVASAKTINYQGHECWELKRIFNQNL
ncbi:hypothetical protein P8452_17013 [Trifolium repens]|nr:hypothetical protein P8452_17013 [Trifolium repens]